LSNISLEVKGCCVLVSLHYNLVRPADHVDVVPSVKFVYDVLAELISCSTWAKPPAFDCFLRVGPEEV